MHVKSARRIERYNEMPLWQNNFTEDATHAVAIKRQLLLLFMQFTVDLIGENGASNHAKRNNPRLHFGPVFQAKPCWYRREASRLSSGGAFLCTLVNGQTVKHRNIQPNKLTADMISKLPLILECHS